jgi:hypothetical protein
MEAITHFVQTDKKVGEHPPTAFLNKKEQQNIFDTKKRIRVSLYKMLLDSAYRTGNKIRRVESARGAHLFLCDIIERTFNPLPRA